MAIPFPIAIVVCDHVYEDSTSRRKTILGTFSRILAAEFPAELPSFSVYVVLSFEGSTQAAIKLQIVDDDDDVIEGSLQSADVQFSGLAAVEMVFVVSKVVAQTPGPIWVQIFCGRLLVVERRIDLEDTSK